jgi:bis(5'-nucleosidyl)-tetraphosphatase
MSQFSAGIIPIYRAKGENYFLLLRIYNYWDFPKGLVEKSENAIQAAQRELEEETGIRKVKFTFGMDFVETEPYGHSKVARYYIAETPSNDVFLGVNPALGRTEHHEFRWVTAREAEKLVNPRIRKVLRWAQSQMKNH